MQNIAHDLLNELRLKANQLDNDEQTKKDYFRQEVINRTAQLADSILLAASEGSVEETNYLTMCFAKKFFDKMCRPFHSDILRYDMERRYNNQRTGP